MICFRWKDYGWQLGQVYITSSTPRLAKKFNNRIKWADKAKGQPLPASRLATMPLEKMQP